MAKKPGKRYVEAAALRNKAEQYEVEDAFKIIDQVKKAKKRK